MAETQVQKQLKVKTNVVIRRVNRMQLLDPRCRCVLTRNLLCRTRKELTNYNIELDKQKEKVAKMRADGRDEHDIKKQVSFRVEAEHRALQACLTSDHARMICRWRYKARQR